MIYIKTNNRFFLNEDVHMGMDIRKLYKIHHRQKRILKNLKEGKLEFIYNQGDKIKGE